MMSSGRVTLSEFLLARIAEDEAAIHKSLLYDDYVGERIRHTMDSVLIRVRHWTITPARILAECEAKRAIVEYHMLVRGLDQDDIPAFGCGICICGDGEHILAGPCLTLRLLALPYQSHQDYQNEWKP